MGRFGLGSTGFRTQPKVEWVGLGLQKRIMKPNPTTHGLGWVGRWVWQETHIFTSGSCWFGSAGLLGQKS